jgi:hypothetical protein
MSGQSLTDVVGSVVYGLSRNLSVDERLHQYIVEMDTRRMQMDPTLDSRTYHCSLIDSFAEHYPDTISCYLETRAGHVPTSFPHDDWTTLTMESEAFQAFLKQHQYTTTHELICLGFDYTVLIETLELDTCHVSRDESVRLWDASRRLAGRPDVSFGVFRVMYSLAHTYVKECVQTRVRLTDEEKRIALRQAMLAKHDLVVEQTE